MRGRGRGEVNAMVTVVVGVVSRHRRGAGAAQIDARRELAAERFPCAGDGVAAYHDVVRRAELDAVRRRTGDRESGDRHVGPSGDGEPGCRARHGDRGTRRRTQHDRRAGCAGVPHADLPVVRARGDLDSLPGHRHRGSLGDRAEGLGGRAGAGVRASGTPDVEGGRRRTRRRASQHRRGGDDTRDNRGAHCEHPGRRHDDLLYGSGCGRSVPPWSARVAFRA